MSQKPIARNQGFSLLELLCSVAILLVISAAALYGLVVYQRSYVGESLRQDQETSVRSASELLQQEVGQAGSLPGVAEIALPTLHAHVTGNSASTQTVTIDPAGSTGYMYVGENLLVDLGANQEKVAITAISGNTVTGVFANTHQPATPVSLAGIIWQGVSVTTVSSTVNQLQLLGDINSDGNLYYVVYTCTQSSTSPYGTLTRSITQLPANLLNAADTLVQGVVPNTDGNNCFTATNSAVTVGANNYVLATRVAVTLTTKSTQVDPQSQQPVTVANTFMNLSPRNILYAYNQALAGSISLWQANPAHP